MPLPFPECPACGEGSPRALHADCEAHGEMLVDPWLGQVRCEACAERWSLRESQIICSCGCEFEAVEVETAADDLIEICQQVQIILDNRDKKRREVARRSEAGMSK